MKKITCISLCFIVLQLYGQEAYKLDSLKLQNWQTGSWEDNFKRHYYFDNGGANDTREYQFLFENSTWDSIARDFKTYNAGLNLTEVVKEVYEETAEEWIVAGRSEFVYNGNNLLSIESQFIPFGPGNFLENDRKEYTYDASDNNIEEVYKVWDAITFQLINDERRLHSYTGTDVIEDIFQDWVGSWLNTERRVYTYNTSGLIEYIDKSEWVSSDWSDILERNTFFYDSNDFNNEILVEEKIGEVFVNDARTLNTFTSNNLVQVISQDWINNTWENVGNLIQMYDANNNIQEQITQIWNVDDWENQTRVLSYWSLAENLSVDFLHLDDEVRLYPNPTSDVLQIKFKEQSKTPLHLVLFDVLGKVMLKKNIPAGLSTFNLPLHHQTNGVYLLEIQRNENKQVYRIVKN